MYQPTKMAELHRWTAPMPTRPSLPLELVAAESHSSKQHPFGLDIAMRTANMGEKSAVVAVAAVVDLEPVADARAVAKPADCSEEDSAANHADAAIRARLRVAKRHQLTVVADALILVEMPVAADADAVESVVVGAVDSAPNPVVADADATGVALVTQQIAVVDATLAVAVAVAVASFVESSDAARADAAVTEPTLMNPLALITEIAECKVASLVVPQVRASRWRKDQ
jgi:hypothetical protein